MTAITRQRLNETTGLLTTGLRDREPAYGCVPQNRGSAPGRGSAEHAADHPDAWVPLPVLCHVSVVRSPAVSHPVVSWLARFPALPPSPRSAACISAIRLPGTSSLRRNARKQEHKRTERNRSEREETPIFSKVNSFWLPHSTTRFCPPILRAYASEVQTP